MPSKTEFYRQMADHVATQLTGSWQEWAGFLTTAARLYKYPFHEQLLIYAQRPDATACAEYDLWNEKMGRYVRRGSKGIALVDDSGDRPRLRYVFDVSDTGTREHSRTPWLWKMEEAYQEPVSAMLEHNYEVSGNDLAQQLEAVAHKLAGEYWNEHRQDLLYIVDDSFLEEYDEFNIEVQFKAAATVSISYALMSRCGLKPERYFTHEDFMAIFDFNTPATIGALGTAVSQINQQVLRQIGVTIRNAEREAIKERRPQHEESHELHPERRLADSRAEAERTARRSPWASTAGYGKAYLKEHRPILYNQLLMSEKLYPHLLEIDETANSRLEQMIPQLAESAGATEELKARDPMRWVGLMNTCKAQVEEILMAELINS